MAPNIILNHYRSNMNVVAAASTAVKCLPAIITFLSIFTARADNYFEFTTGEKYFQEEFWPEGVRYEGYRISESGAIDDSNSGIQWVFSREEGRIIDHLVLRGAMYDSYGGNWLYRYLPAGTPLPYHVLGNLPGQGLYEGHWEIKLRKNPYREDGLWDISRIEINAINIAKLSDPVITICGEDVEVQEPQEYSWAVRSFDQAEGLTDMITISVEAGRPIAFREIRVQLREPETYPSEWEFNPVIPQNPMGRYEIPAAAIGGIEPGSNAVCHVYRLSDMEEAGTNSLIDTTAQTYSVAVPGFGKFGIGYELNETFYGLPLKYSAPDSERLLPLTIQSDFISAGYTLNDAPFMEGISYIHKEAPVTTGHDWTNAVIGNIPEGVTIYWKVEQDDTFQPTTANDRDAVRRPSSIAIAYEAAEDVPEGFTKYDPMAGIDLTQGNRLHLISEQNGGRSDIFSTYYAPYTGPTNVSVLPEGTGRDILEYINAGNTDGLSFYTLQGIRVAYGEVQSGTVMIAVSPTQTLKIVKP